MKMKIMLAAVGIALLAAPLAAENVNGFENFTLSRDDCASSAQAALTDFSSRTRTVAEWVLRKFNSFKPMGFLLILY